MPLRRISTVLAALILAGSAAVLSASAASASSSPAGAAVSRPATARTASTGTCPDGHSGCGTPGWYSVQGTDGTLSVQSTDAVNHVIGSVPEGAPVYADCQRNDGSTDPYDGLSSRTWDYVVAYYNGAWRTGWVYDWYVSTPNQLLDPHHWSLTTVCNFT